MPILALMGILVSHSTLHGGWLERKAEGWAWYEDKEEPEELHEPPPKPESSAATLAEARERLEEMLATAVLEPTKENTLAYMIEQRRWVDQGVQFSNSWALALLDHPELDPTATERPVSQYGIQVFKQLEKKRRDALIRSVAQEHGLFFFYEGVSEASKAIAPVVQQLSQKYGWPVVAISVDGAILEAFPGSKHSSEIANNFDITVFPALIAVNPVSETVIPLAFGLLSADQIELNIARQFDQPEEESNA